MALSPRYSVNLIYFYLSTSCTLLYLFMNWRSYEFAYIAELFSFSFAGWIVDSNGFDVLYFMVEFSSFGYEILDPTFLMLETKDFFVSLTVSIAFWLSKVYVWFILSTSGDLVGSSYFYFKGTSLEDFSLLKVLVIYLSLPDPITCMKTGWKSNCCILK